MKSGGALKRLLVLVLFCVLTGSQAQAGEKKKVYMDFDDADIRVVIKFISELTKKNIIVDNRVKGKVTVISPTEITVNEAYKVFESILQVNGYSAVESAGIIKIVPKPDASKTLPLTRVGKESKKIVRDDRIITQLIPLDYASSTQVRSALAPLISKNGIIIDYPATNTLIITDISSNIHRMVSIVQEIDLEGIREGIEVIALEYADAGALAKQLGSIFPIKKAAPGRGKKRTVSRTAPVFKVIPYERTNSIIVVADEEEMESVRDLVETLDVETEVVEGEIHVYYLKNAVAEDLSKVLSNLARKRRMPQPGKGAAPEAMPLTGDIVITPDKATNALVITASPRDYRIIKDVIEKLDIRRKQVYVEATIMEISLDKQRELGFEFRGTSHPTPTSGLNVMGGSSFGGIETASANPLGLAGQGLVVGAVKGTFTFRGTEYLNVGALLRALETESGVNVLSTPHLLTTDNEEAEIIVGENVPFIVGKSQATGGDTILTTIERKDVGIKLRITPQINESDFVKLKIFQEISNVKEVKLADAADLVTSKRSAKTTIVVKDNQTVAIGGLIRDNEFESVSKVPLLGDIPLLGALFRFKQKKKEKTNLLIFLTPRIIRDSAGLEIITNEMRGDMESFREENISSKEENPPPREKKFPDDEYDTEDGYFWD